MYRSNSNTRDQPQDPRLYGSQNADRSRSRDEQDKRTQDEQLNREVPSRRYGEGSDRHFDHGKSDNAPTPQTLSLEQRSGSGTISTQYTVPSPKKNGEDAHRSSSGSSFFPSIFTTKVADTPIQNIVAPPIVQEADRTPQTDNQRSAIAMAHHMDTSDTDLSIVESVLVKLNNADVFAQERDEARKLAQDLRRELDEANHLKEQYFQSFSDRHEKTQETLRWAVAELNDARLENAKLSEEKETSQKECERLGEQNKKLQEQLKSQRSELEDLSMLKDKETRKWRDVMEEYNTTTDKLKRKKEKIQRLKGDVTKMRSETNKLEEKLLLLETSRDRDGERSRGQKDRERERDRQEQRSREDRVKQERRTEDKVKQERRTEDRVKQERGIDDRVKQEGVKEERTKREDIPRSPIQLSDEENHLPYCGPNFRITTSIDPSAKRSFRKIEQNPPVEPPPLLEPVELAPSSESPMIESVDYSFTDAQLSSYYKLQEEGISDDYRITDSSCNICGAQVDLEDYLEHYETHHSVVEEPDPRGELLDKPLSAPASVGRGGRKDHANSDFDGLKSVFRLRVAVMPLSRYTSADYYKHITSRTCSIAQVFDDNATDSTRSDAWTLLFSFCGLKDKHVTDFHFGRLLHQWSSGPADVLRMEFLFVALNCSLFFSKDPNLESHKKLAVTVHPWGTTLPSTLYQLHLLTSWDRQLNQLPSEVQQEIWTTCNQIPYFSTEPSQRFSTTFLRWIDNPVLHSSQINVIFGALGWMVESGKLPIRLCYPDTDDAVFPNYKRRREETSSMRQHRRVKKTDSSTVAAALLSLGKSTG
ncbi:hypothetical protein PROFUN_08185 [Planoprotostelium fungivorum]|uniref:Uncharacterized protein n=1 Tax=Planoprotostelium fungivorum TaxID=1890364 RepID=A0A2P6N648_9EUKA|nr:hypothetical protein PROFUN_08185 [Planoprotostelium fungivorum]